MYRLDEGWYGDREPQLKRASCGIATLQTRRRREALNKQGRYRRAQRNEFLQLPLGDRRLLRKFRKLLIAEILEDVEAALDHSDPEVAKQRGRRVIRRLKDSSMPFVVARFQCAERAWKKKFPTVPLRVRL